MLDFPKIEIPIEEIPIDGNRKLYIKREDLIHPQISGNKYWKLFYPIIEYLGTHPVSPKIVTFGGAFSNHIAAVSFLGKILKIATLGIIRGEELRNDFSHNPTLSFAQQNSMEFLFVNREEYREKEILKKKIRKEFPHALIIEEGGTSPLAVEGIRYMLSEKTKEFHYLCSAVGTGGTLAGISKFCEDHQRVIGFKMVKENRLEQKILELSGRNNFLLQEPSERYGKINTEVVQFINDFYHQYKIPLDPIYTGKMMMKIFKLLEDGFFPENAKILAFHTGGLQGIAGANEFLKSKKRTLICF